MSKLPKRQSGPFAVHPFFFADQLVTKPTWNDVGLTIWGPFFVPVL